MKPPLEPSDQDRREGESTRRVAPGPPATAAYIAELTAELAKLARESRLEILAYLLDIAQLEAASIVRRRLPGRSAG